MKGHRVFGAVLSAAQYAAALAFAMLVAAPVITALCIAFTIGGK